MKNVQQNQALVAGMIILQRISNRTKAMRLRLLFFTATLLFVTGPARAQAAPDVPTGTGVPGAVCGPAEAPQPENNFRSSLLRGKIHFETGTSANSTTMHFYFASGKRNDTETFFRFSHSHLIESKLLAKTLMCCNTLKAFRQTIRLQKATDKLNC